VPVHIAGGEEQQGVRGPGRVPPKGRDAGDWIDMRPRRRKALRQVGYGQDRYEEAVQLQKQGDWATRTSRFRVSSRDEWYVGNSDDTGTYFVYEDSVLWGDRVSDDFDSDHETAGQHGDLVYSPGRRGNNFSGKRDVVVHQKQHLRESLKEGAGAIKDLSFKRFVTFYITNFPPQDTSFFLSKGV